MGRAVLVWRLVRGDVRRRPLQAALLLVMILTTTTTLTLGLALRRVTENPFDRTRAATRGPDVTAEIGPSTGPVAAQFAALTRAPGVTATAGPYPVASVGLSAHGIAVAAQAEGRDPGPARIDQPKLIAGSWIRPGGAVIESGFATALGLHPGDLVRLNGHRFQVTGVALSTAQCFYPVSQPGVIWLTRGDAQRLATRRQPVGYALELSLADPARAEEFISGPAGTRFFNQTDSESLQSWQDIRREDFRVIAVEQKGLLIGSSMLALLALASIAVVVGGRMTEQTRRVGLLKAVGSTPLLIAVALLAENVALALAAAAAGIAIGNLLAPLLTDIGAGLLVSPPAPPVSLGAVAEVLAAAMVVAGAATVLPAVRGARASTISALNEPAHPPARRAWAIALSARLPVPLLFALRLLARRPRRAALSSASLTIAVTMIVASLALQSRIEHRNQQTGYLVGGDIIERVSHLVYLLSATLVVLAAVSAIVATWTTVIDAAQPTALARALGATPRQISAGLTGAQLIPGLLGACLGIPAGLALYQLAGGDLGEASPPLGWLLAVIPGTLLAVALLTAPLARVGARRPIAEVLRSD